MQIFAQFVITCAQRLTHLNYCLPDWSGSPLQFTDLKPFKSPYKHAIKILLKNIKALPSLFSLIPGKY